jgi:GT2 family glycosyltransferase
MPDVRLAGAGMTTGATRVGLVMAVHNRRETTLRALRSVYDADTSGMTLHVVIVDDGSSDGTSDAVRRAYPDVEIVQGDGTLYFGGGSNAGLRRALAAGVDYAVVANDDVIFNRHAFVELLACARRFPDSVVGALLLPWDMPHRVFQVGQVWDLSYAGWRIPQRLTAFNVPKEPWVVEVLAGNCILVPAVALQRFGLFDDVRFPHLWADVEFSVRVRRGGWRLLVAPRARVFCEPNTYPPPLSAGSIRTAFNALFVNTTHALNVGRRWRMLLAVAPTRTQGIVACAIYIVRLAQRGLRIGSWPEWPDPPLGPLADQS